MEGFWEFGGDIELATRRFCDPETAILMPYLLHS